MPREPRYTRSQILEAIGLEPCHVTGEHNPTHTARYICGIQRSEAFNRLLRLIDVKIEDLPRHLHERCGWCGTHNYGSPASDLKQIQAWAEGAPLATTTVG